MRTKLAKGNSSVGIVGGKIVGKTGSSAKSPKGRGGLVSGFGGAKRRILTRGGESI